MPDPAHKPRLLVLDDDRIMSQSLSLFLRREGYEVYTCDSADEAMHELEGRQIEVLLADIHLPGLKGGGLGGSGGGEFLKEIRRRFPHVVVIVITGYGTIENAVQAVKMGAFEYLTKPIVDEEIRSVVERAVRQQSLLFENQTLKRQLDDRFGLGHIVGHDPKMLRVFELVSAVSEGRTTVLMTGESGTGKSLLARAIHHRSQRRDKPFVEVSCGALPETLLESELFGHMKGSFTGAVADKAGRFLAADGGTLFLDEINSASPAMQVKLLRVLQERCFEPVGSNDTRTVDVRVILATNVDLAELVAKAGFRQDLFYRINVVNVRLPPLRERPGDVTVLAATFLRRLAKEMGREVVGFTDAALSALARHTWPGNVRELENAVERAVLLCKRPVVDVDDLPETVQGATQGAAPAGMTRGGLELPADDVALPLEVALEGPERAIIERALKRNDWNRQNTARELNINRTTLYKKMRKYRLDVGEIN